MGQTNLKERFRMARHEGDNNHNDNGLPRLKGANVIGVKKDGNGDITDFKLDTGETVGFTEAVALVSKGDSSGLLLQAGRYGQNVLRSSPDGRRGNNLDDLPTFN